MRSQAVLVNTDASAAAACSGVCLWMFGYGSLCIEVQIDLSYYLAGRHHHHTTVARSPASPDSVQSLYYNVWIILLNLTKHMLRGHVIIMKYQHRNATRAPGPVPKAHK